MKEQWWHLTCFDGSQIVKGDHFSNLRAFNHNSYGPFKSFALAQRDAIEYHRATKLKVRKAIADLQKMKRSDYD